MQLKVEIRTTGPDAVETKSGTSKRTGKAYSMREQHGFCSFPNGEQRRVTFSLENDEQPMALGMYEPKDSAIYAGDFGSIAVSMRARHWQPLAAVAVRKVG